MKLIRSFALVCLAVALLASVGAAQATRHGGSGAQVQPHQPAQQPVQQQQLTPKQLRLHQERLTLMNQTRERVMALEQRAESLSQNLRMHGEQSGLQDPAMQQLCDSLRDTTREMRRSMDRLHAAMDDSDYARLRDQDRDKVQDRDRDQILDVDKDQLMDRDQDRDQLFDRDPDWDRDMDRLRRHIEDMAGPMDDALNVMERLQDRLHQQ